MNRMATTMTNSYGRSLDRIKAEMFSLEIVVANRVGADPVEAKVEVLVTVVGDATVCELI